MYLFMLTCERFNLCTGLCKVVACSISVNISLPCAASEDDRFFFPIAVLVAAAVFFLVIIMRLESSCVSVDLFQFKHQLFKLANVLKVIIRNCGGSHFICFRKDAENVRDPEFDRRSACLSVALRRFVFLSTVTIFGKRREHKQNQEMATGFIFETDFLFL